MKRVYIPVSNRKLIKAMLKQFKIMPFYKLRYYFVFMMAHEYGYELDASFQYLNLKEKADE